MDPFAGLSNTGGGGGGRLAVRFTAEEWTGSFEAYGGTSTSGFGGAGTVYVESGSKTKIIIANKEAFTIKASLAVL